MTLANCPVTDPHRGRRAFLLAGLAMGAAPARAEAPQLPVATALPQHLEAALAKRQPLVVMVSLPGCPFCKVARENYLLPLWREQGLPIVQVDMQSSRSLRDFTDSEVTHDAQIRSWRVRMAPTVLFFGRGGSELAKRLIGAGVPDFYGAYLEERLAIARKALA